MDKEIYMWYELQETGVPFLIPAITEMNDTFELEANSIPTDLGRQRLEAFIQVFKDEVDELNHVHLNGFDEVALADCFADLLVYLLSECRRWGIPVVPVFHIVMESQRSKLVDGKPVKAPDGSKFIKGPHYTPPEENIKLFLKEWRDKHACTRT